MIERLSGRVLTTSGEHVIVDVSGVGFSVIAPASTLARIPPVGGQVSLFTKLVVREDSLTLYGFLSEAESRLFSRLIGVGGVGPRVAIAVLSVVSPEDFDRAVTFGDSEFLTTVPGVGRKLADRMILELKDRHDTKRRAQRRQHSPAPAVSPAAEAVDALTALGYTRIEAGQAVGAIVDRLDGQPTTERLVHESLKSLGKRD